MCHALAKHGRPFSNFVCQCELDESRNVDIYRAYRNDKHPATDRVTGHARGCARERACLNRKWI